MQSTEIGKLAEALSKAQSEIIGAKKDSENPFFKSAYADLQSVWESIRGPLTKNNLCVIQTTEITESGVVVCTTLAHSSGQWIDSKLRLTPTKNDPQAIGSAISYGRRYQLAAITGVAQIDDDAEAAHGRNHQVLTGPGTPTNSTPANHSPGPVKSVQGNDQPQDPTKVSMAQLKRLYAIQLKAQWTTEQVRDVVKAAYGYESLRDLTKEQYDYIVFLVEKMTFDQAIAEAAKE